MNRTCVVASCLNNEIDVNCFAFSLHLWTFYAETLVLRRIVCKLALAFDGSSCPLLVRFYHEMGNQL